jgi:hypothetical protein
MNFLFRLLRSPKVQGETLKIQFMLSISDRNQKIPLMVFAEKKYGIKITHCLKNKSNQRVNAISFFVAIARKNQYKPINNCNIIHYNHH